MAVSLGILGRGKRQYILYFALFQIFGTTVGGAFTGGLLGVLGTFCTLYQWRVLIIALTTIFALWQSMYHRPKTLGLHRQVPRKWSSTLVSELRFFLWGILLGSGIATIIPYSAFFIVLATQLTSNLFVGALSGAMFGMMRGIAELFPLCKKQYRISSERIPLLFFALRQRVQQLNVFLLVGGGILLVVSSWHS